MKKLSIVACALCVVFLLSLGSVTAAESRTVRKSKKVFFGVTPFGLHIPTIIAMPMGAGFYIGDSALFGFEMASASSKQNDGDSESSASFTNRGLYGRWFPGNSFNVMLAFHQRKFVADATVTDSLTSSTANAKLIANAQVGTIAIGNQWSFDWGLVVGADWVVASALLGSSTSVDLVSSTYADSSQATKDLKDFADILNLISGLPGFVNVTVGFAF